MKSHIEKLILASRSPRRRELLAEAGYDFDIVVPDEAAESSLPASLLAALPGAEEDPGSPESSEQFVARLAWQKAANVAAHRPRLGPRL